MNLHALIRAALCVALALITLPAPAQTPDARLAYVPDDAHLLLSLDVERLESSQSAARILHLIRQHPDLAPLQSALQGAPLASLTPSLLLAASGEDSLLIARLTTPDPELTALLDTASLSYTLAETPPEGTSALALVDDRDLALALHEGHLLLGSERAVRASVERGRARGEGSEATRARVGQVDRGAPVYGVLHFDEALRERVAGAFPLFARMTGLHLSVHASDGLTITLHATLSSVSEAARVLERFSLEIQGASVEPALIELEMLPLVDNVMLAQSDDVLRLFLTLSAEEVDAIASSIETVLLPAQPRATTP